MTISHQDLRPSGSAATRPRRLVCFAHGKESGPWGTKITHLAGIARKTGFDAISPDYSHTHDARERVAQLLALAPSASQTLVLVGSSMGGYVTAMACGTLRPQAMLLIAPALYFPGFDEEPAGTPALTTVVHGWNDDIVPVERAVRFATPRRAELHLLDSGHTLNERLDDLGSIFGHLLQRAIGTAT
jgi:alpha/beta superfamily hydrolase